MQYCLHSWGFDQSGRFVPCAAADWLLHVIDKLCNMHGVPVGAWDIGSIPVRPMTTSHNSREQASVRSLSSIPFGVSGGPQKLVSFVQHKGCTTWFQKGCTALKKTFQDIMHRCAHLWVLLKDGRGTRRTPFPNLFEINTLHTTMCSVLKWSQSISGVALMPLAPIKTCQKKVLDVQNSLQTVPQL